MNENVFDRLADDYSNVHKKSLSIFSNMDLSYFVSYKVNILKDHIFNLPKNILDFGCGIGLSSKYISEQFPMSKIWGIDTSSLSIEKAKKLKISNAIFSCVDITKQELNLPLFDVIFVSCVFQHIMPKDRQKVLSKLLSLLSKNGKLFIFEHNPYNPITNLIYNMTEIDNGCCMMSHFELNKILKEIILNDFVIYQTFFSIFMPRYMFLSKIFFLEKYLKKIPIGAQYYKIIQRL